MTLFGLLDAQYLGAMSRVLGNNEAQRKVTVYAWYERLKGHTLEEVKHGYDTACRRHPDYPPTLPQFAAVVKATMAQPVSLPPPGRGPIDMDGWNATMATARNILAEEGKGEGLDLAYMFVENQQTPEAAGVRRQILSWKDEREKATRYL